MTTEQWQQIESLFEAALEQPTEARAHYLAEACDDPQVQREVARMLAASDKAETFLEAPAQVFAADLVAAEEDTPAVEHVGPYRLVREIGRGGMGTVFLAERADGAFEQRVAVKLLRSGVGAGRGVERFLAERQILASLAHPHIARLYDGGVTDPEPGSGQVGVPYFVMEYVDGQPIDDYCDAGQLPIRERLRLFVTVGRVVQYAHQRLVVHRDLKPSNILVTEGGQVKLLDFGIAKLLSDDAEAGLTRTGMPLMTPEYASPEQVRGEPITTASDVYQLGLLLYELLTGRRPHQFATRSLVEVARVVTEKPPVRPSTAVTQPTEGLTPEDAGRARSTTPQRLRRRLRGDLDAIVMKALRKEPEERYGSVGQLVEEVERYLAGEPVAARRGTAMYRLRKFVMRHRWGVAVSGFLLLLLVGFGSWHTARVTHERDRAEYYAAFLTDLFASPDPMASAEAAGHRDITVREFLNQGVHRVRNELADDPVMQTDLLYTIAQVNQRLGYREAARDLYEDVLARRQYRYDEASPEVVEVMRHLAWVTEDDAIADSLYHRQLELARRLEGGTGPITARSLAAYGDFLQDHGRLQEAERVLDEALVAKQAIAPEYDEDLIGVLLFAGQVKRALGQLSIADSLIREAYAIRSAIDGDDHPRTAIIMAEMGVIAERQGDLGQAEQLKRRVLAIFEEALGPEHAYTVAALNNLALLLGKKEAYPEAEQLMRRVLALREEQQGPEHSETVDAMQNLATLLVKQGRLDEAEPLFRQVHARYQKTLPPSHFRIAFPLLSLTDLYVQQGAFEQAEAAAREAVDHLRRALPEEHPLIAVAESRWGGALARQRRFAEAEPLLVQGYDDLQAAEGYDTYQENARQRLVALYEAWNQPGKAALYRVRSETEAP